MANVAPNPDSADFPPQTGVRFHKSEPFNVSSDAAVHVSVPSEVAESIAESEPPVDRADDEILTEPSIASGAYTEDFYEDTFEEGGDTTAQSVAQSKDMDSYVISSAVDSSADERANEIEELQKKLSMKKRTLKDIRRKTSKSKQDVQLMKLRQELAQVESEITKEARELEAARNRQQYLDPVIDTRVSIGAGEHAGVSETIQEEESESGSDGDSARVEERDSFTESALPSQDVLEEVSIVDAELSVATELEASYSADRSVSRVSNVQPAPPSPSSKPPRGKDGEMPTRPAPHGLDAYNPEIVLVKSSDLLSAEDSSSSFASENSLPPPAAARPEVTAPLRSSDRVIKDISSVIMSDIIHDRVRASANSAPASESSEEGGALEENLFHEKSIIEGDSFDGESSGSEGKLKTRTAQDRTCNAVADTLLNHLIRDTWVEVENIRALRIAREDIAVPPPSSKLMVKTVTVKRGGGLQADDMDFADVADDFPDDGQTLPSDVPDLYDMDEGKDDIGQDAIYEEETCDWAAASQEYASQLLSMAFEHGFGKSPTHQIPIEAYLKLEGELKVPEHIQIAHKLVFDAINSALLDLFPPAESSQKEMLEGLVSPRSTSSSVDNKSISRVSRVMTPAWCPARRETRKPMNAHSMEEVLDVAIATALRFDLRDRGPPLPAVAADPDAPTERIPQLWMLPESERMDTAIRTEMDFREKGWLDYDADEGSIVYDVADVLLGDLLRDTISEVEVVMMK